MNVHGLNSVYFLSEVSSSSRNHTYITIIDGLYLGVACLIKFITIRCIAMFLWTLRTIMSGPECLGSAYLLDAI